MLVLSGTIREVARALQLMQEEAEANGMTALEYYYWSKL